MNDDFSQPPAFRCPNCGKPLMSHVGICPNCGYQLVPRKSTANDIVAWLLLIFIGGPAALFASCGFSLLPHEPALGLMILAVGVAVLAGAFYIFRLLKGPKRHQ